jgi:hypothetical protein
MDATFSHGTLATQYHFKPQTTEKFGRLDEEDSNMNLYMIKTYHPGRKRCSHRYYLKSYLGWDLQEAKSLEIGCSKNKCRFQATIQLADDLEIAQEIVNRIFKTLNNIYTIP